MPDFVIAFKCNNNCISCINNTDNTSLLNLTLSHKDILDFINNLDKSTKYIAFTGGEPTIRKDLFTILKHTRNTNKDLYILLLSNGRMFAYKDYCKKLNSLKLNYGETPYTDLFRIGIPLYSHKEEIHDKITRINGSFQQTVRGIKNLLEYNFKIELRIIVNKINYKDLPKTAEFIAKEFPNLDRVVFINMKITGNAFKNRKQVLIKYSQGIPFVQKAVDILEKNKMPVRLFHFPLCIIDKKYWNIARGITKDEWDLSFAPQCEKCIVKNKCPRIWKSYVYAVGTHEFKPIVK